MRKIFIFIILCMLTIYPILSAASNLKIEENKIEKNNDEIYIETTDDLPAYFNWQDYNGKNFVTPIRNQAPFQSCETFSIVAAMESMIQIKLNYTFNCDLSEAHLWFNSEPSLKWGSYPDNNLKYLKDHGIPDEGCWPYPSENKIYPPNSTCDFWKERAIKITGWEFLPHDQISIKKALIENGPIPTYIFLYKDFMWYQGGIYRHTWGQPIAPHMVTIVGYNDDPGYWIVKNSWGEKWGENGWFRIEYGQNSIEFYSILIKDVYGKFPITYVDDDNTKGPWHGTEKEPYQTIQDAIDNSYSSYTVVVKNGEYNENIVIDKKLYLKGEDKEKTIITGIGFENVVNITAENVEISGFTIQNSGKDLFDAGIIVTSKYLMQDSNTTITDNIIKNNSAGVRLFTACSNVVKNNIIEDNNVGIFAMMTLDNIIEGNIIRKNSENGIQLEWACNTNIIGNTIEDNKNSGIYLQGSSNENNIKENNTFKNNNIGINLVYSDKNIISGNNFIGNKKHATFNDSYLNKWNKNYWDDHQKLFFKIIKGKIGKRDMTWFNIDWFPAKQPY